MRGARSLSVVPVPESESEATVGKGDSERFWSLSRRGLSFIEYNDDGLSRPSRGVALPLGSSDEKGEEIEERAETLGRAVSSSAI